MTATEEGIAMANYYSKQLHSHKLFQVYDTAYPRIKQYLDAEISFVAGRLRSGDSVLELGAGYGRILKQLAPHAAKLTGVDFSRDSVELSKHYLAGSPNCQVLHMDVGAMRYDSCFDVVLGLQNTLSAIKRQPMELIRLSIQALSSGGKAYFSTYSENFWEQRLLWFREQAEKGLLGELDMNKTRDGVIVCKDGFTAVTFSREDLEGLGDVCGYPYSVQEVDRSSLFLIIEKK